MLLGAASQMQLLALSLYLSSSVHSIKMSQSLKLKQYHTFPASVGRKSMESSVSSDQT